jgi:hypothetical protein
MYCDRCGKELHETATFCSGCGKSAKATPLMPPQGRIAGHVRLLGILWLAISAFRIIPGLAVILIFGNRSFPPGAPPFLHDLLQFVGVAFLFGAALGLAIGCGLLMRLPWARMLAIVFGGLNLPDIPFGTALGIYTLWALLPSESEQEYRSMAGSAARAAQAI